MSGADDDPEVRRGAVVISLERLSAPPARHAWFREATFGMFIHWGLYALLGRGEWVMNREAIPADEYRVLADEFSAEGYDPDAWAQLASDAGMKYMVLTTKHHEGFCLWDSKVRSFNSVQSAAKRDLVAEYVEAARRHGLGVGFYYSLGDWYNPAWQRAVTTRDADSIREMAEETRAMVRELLTQYGSIDILWYDLPQGMTAEDWRSRELNAMARSLQPGILINNRALTVEDISTHEQSVGEGKESGPWESCITLNRNWGFCPSDFDYKSPRDVALLLAQTATRGGNLLLNVGPDGTGRIPTESQEILSQVGGWVRDHAEAIYGLESQQLPFNLWGPTGVRGSTMYLFLASYPGAELTMGGLTNRVVSAEFLTTGQPLTVRQSGRQVKLSGLPTTAPDALLPVVKVVVEGRPDQDLSREMGGADIMVEFPTEP